EPFDNLCDAAMVSADDPAQILGIDPCGQRRRADEIAEHHRQLTAFGSIGARWERRGWRSRSSGFPNGLSAAAAELRAGLVLECAGWALRGQWRSALSTEAPALCVFGHAAWAAHSEPWASRHDQR